MAKEKKEEMSSRKKIKETPNKSNAKKVKRDASFKGPQDDEDMDMDDMESYSHLDDDELLELALKDEDDEGEATKRTKLVEEQGSIKKRKKRVFSKANVLYLGHIPHGFFEHEIKNFLSQFGKVLQVRVSRNKKTGGSRGYAFIQFLHKEVAAIVQKTLHGYILTGKSLVCQHVPEEHVHEKMFLGGLSGKNSVVETYSGARKKRVLAHGVRSEKDKAVQRRLNRLVKSDKARKEKLAASNIKYDFLGYDKR